jgi:hypothetical protein
MGSIKKKKCKHCRELFLPDPRNAKRQKYCSKPDCRKASKKDSQQRWLSKPENREHFCGPTNVSRVQQWRKDNPGYWKKSKNALQDSLIGQPTVNIDDTVKSVHNALQDSLITQPAVLIGLIAHFTDFALQDNIAKTLHLLQQLGQDILNSATQTKGGQYDSETSHRQKSHPKSSQAVQLGRSPTGP